MWDVVISVILSIWDCVSSGGGDQTSDWIDVSGNKYITITLYEDFTNTNNSGRYCEYDADKNCINTVGYNPRQKSSIIIELKTTTKYIRVNSKSVEFVPDLTNQLNLSAVWLAIVSAAVSCWSTSSGASV